jgi:hypothetical protein
VTVARRVSCAGNTGGQSHRLGRIDSIDVAFHSLQKLVVSIGRLLEAVPGFADAPEYLALDESAKRLPYIVAARASDYWERLEREQRSQVLNTLSEGLESLARDGDAAVQDLLVAILNPLGSDSPVAGRMKLRLGPNAKALFEKFVR